MSNLKVRKDRAKAKVMKATKSPILSVFRSNKHIYGYVTDHKTGNTLYSVNTLQESFAKLEKKSNIAAAEELGKKVAEMAMKSGIKQIVFNKSGYKYHGKVKAIAEKVREAGIKI